MTDIITQPLNDTGPGFAGDSLTRREALGKGVSLASSVVTTVALASVPAALGVFARTARAQAPVSVRSVLEFAYLVENLESEFYKAILGTSGTAAQNDAFAPVRAQIASDIQLMGTLRQIAKHEAAHVAYLRTQISQLGGAPITYTGAEFDFTGGNGAATPGPFSAVRNDPATLLALAQLFEDTGVRAYKGQLDKLVTDAPVLTAALKIHSVEARHAARIRVLRNVTGLKPWITSSATATTTGITATGGGSAATASIAATATGYSRASGSFITDGFAVGQQITAAGFTNAANNGLATVTAVTATALTVSKTPGTVVEAAATGRFLISRLGMTPAGNAVVTRVYVRETNSIQKTVDMSGLGSNTGGVSGVNEAFDEPLTYDDVIFIIKDFVIGATP